MLSALLRDMLAVMYKDILSTHLKIISNHFNALQFKQDQDKSHQLIVRINPLFFIYYLSQKKTKSYLCF
jgi:hypothetical protein